MVNNCKYLIIFMATNDIQSEIFLLAVAVMGLITNKW